MSWDGVNAKVTACRDAIIACPSAVTLGISSTAQHHYPESSTIGDSLPQVVYEETEYSVERHATGETYATGTIAVTMYLDGSSRTPATLEQYAASLAHELCSTTSGLFITGVTRSIANRRNEASIAAYANATGAELIVCTLDISWQG